MQMRVDVLGLPGRIAARGDSSAVGAAMLAGVAGGVLPDLQAAARLVQAEPAALLEPDPQASEAYATAYARYRQLFQCLRPIFDAEAASA
jgi:ribulose kinase